MIVSISVTSGYDLMQLVQASTKQAFSNASWEKMFRVLDSDESPIDIQQLSLSERFEELSFREYCKYYDLIPDATWLASQGLSLDFDDDRATYGEWLNTWYMEADEWDLPNARAYKLYRTILIDRKAES